MVCMICFYFYFCGFCWVLIRVGVVCCNDIYNFGCYDLFCVYYLLEFLVRRYIVIDFEEYFEEGYDYFDYYYYDEYDDIDFFFKGWV